MAAYPTHGDAQAPPTKEPPPAIESVKAKSPGRGRGQRARSPARPSKEPPPPIQSEKYSTGGHSTPDRDARRRMQSVAPTKEPPPAVGSQKFTFSDDGSDDDAPVVASMRTRPTGSHANPARIPSPPKRKPPRLNEENQADCAELSLMAAAEGNSAMVERAQAAIRAQLEHSYYERMKSADKKMPRVLFMGILGFLTLVDLEIMGMMFCGVWEFDDTNRCPLRDERYWLNNPNMSFWEQQGEKFRTPYHDKTNVFGDAWSHQLLVQSHIVTGAGLFAVCLVPMFVAKGGTLHLLFGRVFVVLWLLHLVNGLHNSMIILTTRGLVEERYISGKERAEFSLWLYVQFGM